ncbi:hypothetical protein OCS_00375 [Ophiocordyceps sinensis CO18]|uniref:AT hook, DNA-binding motif protein n=1 Tax=Ophiocordyceps sinensis (strain Co18 / CGMCC 3.14243) TaxID=911162 RepID=T5AQA8_OPHSC|nr:hypothetical protein OCS_00375 [Ophiocordyceps sinensis CO18]
MSPIVIADSDDDIDERGNPLSPQPIQATASSDAHARSSDHVSLATGSTDPAFFQSVFNEQNEAATHETRQKSAVNRSVAALSSAVARLGGEVTASSRISDSAPTSQQSAFGEFPSPTSQRHHVAMMATATKDVWDVPSSPERKALSGPSKMKGSRSKGVKITRGSRKNLERLGCESEDEAKGEESRGHGRVDLTPAKERKRRRLDLCGSSWDTFSPGLTTILSQDEREPLNEREMGDAAVGELVPTLPESSFLVAPIPLSASQKFGYQSIELVQGSPPSRNPEVPYNKMGSSGTATNLNTPRSDIASSHDVGIRAPTPESEAICNKRRMRPPPRRRRSSSPDAIALTSHRQDKGAAEKPEPKRASGTGDAERDDHLLDEELGGQQADDDSDFAVAAKPVTGKGPRGRPRKGAGSGGGKKTGAAAAADAGTQSKDMPKKKRGRPKKVKQGMKADQESPGRVTLEAQASAGVEELGDVDAPRERPEDNKASSEKRGPCSPSQRHREEASDGSKRPTAAEERAGKEDEIGRGKVEEATDKSKVKGSFLLGLAGKPVYRVGLSKRLRIAPLLKTLPK